MSIAFRACGAGERRDEHFLYRKQGDGSWRATYGIVANTLVDPDADPVEEVLVHPEERVAFDQACRVKCQITGSGPSRCSTRR